MNLATLWSYSEVPGSWDQAASSAEHLRLCPSLYELRKTNSVDRKQSEANPVSCFPICLQGTITRCNKWVLLFLCKILPCVEELTSAHTLLHVSASPLHNRFTTGPPVLAPSFLVSFLIRPFLLLLPLLPFHYCFQKISYNVNRLHHFI